MIYRVEAPCEVGGSKMRNLAFLNIVLFGLMCPVVARTRICAFNIQRFGMPKMVIPSLRDPLVKIIARCDICLLQEVQDITGRAVIILLKELNRVSGSKVFANISSAALGRRTYREPALGRRAYREQYVFVYRLDKAQVMAFYQYEDNDPANPDAFAREPFIVRFCLLTAELQDLVMVPQHTSPQNASQEIDALYDVFQEVKKRWKPPVKNIMLLGDFNADCNYVTKKQWRGIRLRLDPSLKWLIGDDMDTTVREKTHCAYDRIVIFGEQLKQMVVSGSAKAYNFTEHLKLTEAQALELSDHYPVEVVLHTPMSFLPFAQAPGHLLWPGTTTLFLLATSVAMGYFS